MGFGAQRFGVCGASMNSVATTSVYPVFIAMQSLPGATVGTPYSATFTAGGGNGPYLWSVVAGALPDGLSMDSNGNITGTPTAAGVFNFDVQVIDALGNTAIISVGVAL